MNFSRRLPVLPNYKIHPYANTTYHYRVIVARSVWAFDWIDWEDPVILGAEKSFTTAGPPSVDSESVSNVTPVDATLEAQINPESEERGALFQFQVVRSTSDYRAKFTCPTEGFPAGTSLCALLMSQEGALPLGHVSPGEEDQPVSLNLSEAGMELQPSTNYHFRVIAARSVWTVDTIAWVEPIVYGVDRTFVTGPAEEPTEVEIQDELEKEGAEGVSGPPGMDPVTVSHPQPSGGVVASRPRTHRRESAVRCGRRRVRHGRHDHRMLQHRHRGGRSDTRRICTRVSREQAVAP